jgi:hypothetical protein
MWQQLQEAVTEDDPSHPLHASRAAGQTQGQARSPSARAPESPHQGSIERSGEDKLHQKKSPTSGHRPSHDDVIEESTMKPKKNSKTAEEEHVPGDEERPDHLEAEGQEGEEGDEYDDDLPEEDDYVDSYGFGEATHLQSNVPVEKMVALFLVRLEPHFLAYPTRKPVRKRNPAYSQEEEDQVLVHLSHSPLCRYWLTRLRNEMPSSPQKTESFWTRLLELYFIRRRALARALEDVKGEEVSGVAARTLEHRLRSLRAAEMEDQASFYMADE